MELGRFKLIALSDDVSDRIYELVYLWDRFNQDTLGRQLVRAADSISANLSEGYGRYSFSDRKRFAYYARGSLCETINWIEKASRRKLIDVDTSKELQTQLTNISYKLNYFIRSLKNHE